MHIIFAHFENWVWWANIGELLYTKSQQEKVLVLENALKCVLNRGCNNRIG